jgi:hypothetical protein
VHTSIETGWAHACAQQGRSASAAWRAEAMPAAREGHASPRSCRLCFTRRRRLYVASGTAVDDTSARARPHAIGQNGV